MARAMTANKIGPIRHKRKRWWPVWEMTKAEVLQYIAKFDMLLSWEYDFLPSSFSGLDYQYSAMVKRHSEADWRRNLEWYPVMEAEHYRYEQAKARGGRQ
jgi:hypothetical protein